MICNCCGQTIKTARKPATKPHEIACEAIAAMNDSDLRAHYAKTAPYEDVRFALKYNLPMSDALRADWLALLAIAYDKPKTEIRRRLYTLQLRRWAEQERTSHVYTDTSSTDHACHRVSA